MGGIRKFVTNSSVPALIRILMVSMGIGALATGCASQQQQTLTAIECDELSPKALLEAIENGECRAFLTKLEKILPAARRFPYTGSPDTLSDGGRGGSSLGDSTTQATAETNVNEPGGNDTGGNDTGGNDTGGKGDHGGHGGRGGHGGGHGPCR